MLVFLSVLFFTFEVNGQLVITRKAEETISYAQSLEYYKIKKEDLKAEVDAMKAYTRLGEKRMTEVAEAYEDKCEGGEDKCEDHATTEKAPDDISTYNGYKVKKLKSKMKKALSQCDDNELINPTSDEEMSELKALMKKHGTTKQPIKAVPYNNYVIQLVGDVIYDQLAVSTSSGSEIKYYYLALNGEDLNYMGAAIGEEEVDFLCLYRYDDLETNKAKYLGRIERISKKWQEIAKIIDDVHSKLQICKPNEKETGGSDTNLKGLDFFTNITRVYRLIERLGHERPGADVWRGVDTELVHIITLGQELLQGADNCFLYQCIAAMNTKHLELKCDRTKDIKGKGIYFHPFPFTRGSTSYVLPIDHIVTDHSYQYCVTTVNKVIWNLDPRCCEEIDSVSSTSTAVQLTFCPIVEMRNAPLVVDFGPYKQITGTDSTVETKCGTERKRYKVKDGEVASFYGDCKVKVDNGRMDTQIAGFGKKLMMHGLEEVKEKIEQHGLTDMMTNTNFILWMIILAGTTGFAVFLCRSRGFTRLLVHYLGCLRTACCREGICERKEREEEHNPEDATPLARRRTELSGREGNRRGVMFGMPYNIANKLDELNMDDTPSAPANTLTRNNLN